MEEVGLAASGFRWRLPFGNDEGGEGNVEDELRSKEGEAPKEALIRKKKV